jgi:hypothetical protein
MGQWLVFLKVEVKVEWKVKLMVSDEAVLSVDLRALNKADRMDLLSAYLMAS